MTILRLTLGVLWLSAAFVWLGLIICPHLWHAYTYRNVRGETGVERFVVFGNLKAFCFVGSGIAMALCGIWWEVAMPCFYVALLFFLLGVGLLYFEAPVRDLFEMDDEAVLSNEEMLNLWYGGLNTRYVRDLRASYQPEYGCRYSKRELEYNFVRTNAWSWDAPYLRALAYYLKGQSPMFLLLVVLLWLVSDMVEGIVEMNTPLLESVLQSPGTYARDLVSFLVVAVLFPFAHAIRREWMGHYRTLVRALREGENPDLSDRARLAEMRRAILGWGQEKGYVYYDRTVGAWKLLSEEGRMIA